MGAAARPRSVDELRRLLSRADPRDGVRLCARSPSSDPLARSIVLNEIPGASEARGAMLQVPARVSAESLLDAAWRLCAVPAYVPALPDVTVGSALATGAPARWGSCISGLDGFELVPAVGEALWVTPRDEPDLFGAIPGSLGTLGFVSWSRQRLVSLAPGPEPRVETRAIELPDAGTLVDRLVRREDPSADTGVPVVWGLVGPRGPAVVLQSRIVSGEQPLRGASPPGVGGWRRQARFGVGSVGWALARWAGSVRRGGVVEPLRAFLFEQDGWPQGPWRMAQDFVVPAAVPFLEAAQASLSDAGLSNAWMELRRAPADALLWSPSRGLDGLSVRVVLHGWWLSGQAPARRALRALSRVAADLGGRVRLVEGVEADPDVLASMYAEVLEPFRAVKARVDPAGVLRHPLVDGLFGPRNRPSGAHPVGDGPRDPTLAHAIAQVGSRCPDRGFVFQDAEGRETWMPYPEVERRTASRAGALQTLGLRRGDRVGLLLERPEDFVLTFLAAIRVGVVPVPMYPPLALVALDAHADGAAAILEVSEARMLIASAPIARLCWSLVGRVRALERLVVVDDLVDAAPAWPDLQPEDTAFLQFTSGSTAQPRGVVVTHGALMANLHAMIVHGVRKGLGEGVLVSWLPLYHDMGLVGFVLAAVAHGLTSVLIPTMRFVRRPSVWFEAVHRHRATMSCAPSFGYALITRRVREEDLSRWDLSSLEVLVCGAEPIHAPTIRAFQTLFTERCKLDPAAFLPAYGMAEATLAITFKPGREVWRTRRVDAEQFERERVAAPPGVGRYLEHVSCGRTFPGHEVGVFATDGARLPDGREGEIWFRGPSVTAGYFRDPAATRATFTEGWLRTGDLGYQLEGELYVTGRVKDIVIVRGRNLHPQAIEWRVAEVSGVRRGNVVAFAAPGEAGEALIVALEARTPDPARLRAEVAAAVLGDLGVAPTEVVVLPRGSLPKTSSGKLRRREARARYLAGTLAQDRRWREGRGRRAVARHVARSAWTRLRVAWASGG